MDEAQHDQLLWEIDAYMDRFPFRFRARVLTGAGRLSAALATIPARASVSRAQTAFHGHDTPTVWDAAGLSDEALGLTPQARKEDGTIDWSLIR